jgi:acetyl-CoA acetyltransferase
VLKRTGIDPEKIDEVIAGNVCQPSEAPNIARVAALRVHRQKFEKITGVSVQRNCASGIEAISTAYRMWKAGDGEIFLVGGTENMSQVPYLIKGTRKGLKLGHFYLIDGLWEGLTDPIVNQIMGRTAENLAEKYKISREDQDAFAVWSHQKAFKARQEGKFNKQIVPVTTQQITNIGGKLLIGEKNIGIDECINPNISKEELAKEVTIQQIIEYYLSQYEKEKIIDTDEGINSKLDKQSAGLLPAIFLDENLLLANYPKAKYDKGKIILETKVANKGTITPKNSCPISDGAAAMLVMPESKAKELNLTPEAYIVSYAYAACDPAYMGEGPIYAVPKALNRAGLKIEEIDFWELNEAFAVQALACQRVLGIPDEKLNIWGGAIALGHPVGATGAYLTVKAIHILKEYQKRYAAITMCVGGGQGGCLIIERA